MTGAPMDDRTESLEPYEAASYEWDYEEAADRPPRVLWGRVLALIVLLAVAFWLGRQSAPSSTNSAALADAREELQEAQDEIEGLEEQITTGTVADPTPEPEPTPEETTTTTGEDQTYTVKSGDSLAAIALEFYGDSSLADVIAEANDINNPASIRPGDVLIIPPEPTD